MSVTKKDAEQFLAKRGIPEKIYIVPVEIVFVSSAIIKNIEILSIIDSLLLLLGGVFLGVILTPESKNFVLFLITGIVLVVLSLATKSGITECAFGSFL
jgi:ABC-type multidrug transport system permease subunit